MLVKTDKILPPIKNSWHSVTNTSNYLQYGKLSSNPFIPYQLPMNQNIFTGKFSRNKRKTTLTQYLRHKLTFSSDRYLMVFGPKTEFPRYSSIHFSHFFYDPQLIQSPSLTPSAIPPPLPKKVTRLQLQD